MSHIIVTRLFALITITINSMSSLDAERVEVIIKNLISCGMSCTVVQRAVIQLWSG